MSAHIDLVRRALGWNHASFTEEEKRDLMEIQQEIALHPGRYDDEDSDDLIALAWIAGYRAGRKDAK